MSRNLSAATQSGVADFVCHFIYQKNFISPLILASFIGNRQQLWKAESLLEIWVDGKGSNWIDWHCISRVLHFSKILLFDLFNFWLENSNWKSRIFLFYNNLTWKFKFSINFGCFNLRFFTRNFEKISIFSTIFCKNNKNLELSEVKSITLAPSLNHYKVPRAKRWCNFLVYRRYWGQRRHFRKEIRFHGSARLRFSGLESLQKRPQSGRTQMENAHSHVHPKILTHRRSSRGRHLRRRRRRWSRMALHSWKLQS